MPGYARKKSNSKVYHVMLRRIDRRPVFFDNNDKIRFRSEAIENGIKNFKNRKKKRSFKRDEGKVSQSVRELSRILGISKDIIFRA